MGSAKSIPRRLYKYRDLSNRTVDMLVSDNIYYADPSTFNDPLDSQPSLEIDIEDAALETILRHFVEQRAKAEMTTAAKTIKYRGPKTIDHIKRHSRRQADELIAEIEYYATEPGYNSEERQRSLLKHYIEEELLRQYEKGIVSLAKRAVCPLMWSHYGDQHRGVCIGYSIPQNARDNIHEVAYGGSRLVEASKVAALLDGDEFARSQVDEAVLLRKAASWRYEHEWRLIGRRGLQRSPLELEEVIFGMRCKDSVKYAVAKALQGRDRAVKFFEMNEVPGTFELKKQPLDRDDELFVHFPYRSISIFEDFEITPTGSVSTGHE